MLFLLGATVARAHGPFDHSAQLMVGEAQLEFVVTMGADATQAFLAAAQFPADVQVEVARRTRSQTPSALPTEIAARLAEITVGGKPLAARQVKVITAGLETVFTVVFPRPDGGELEVRALYFNGIEAMKQGTLVALDENQRQLGAALLSRTRDSAQITLPPKIEAVTHQLPATDVVPASPHQPLVKMTDALPPVSDPRFAGNGSAGWKLSALGLTILIVLLAAVVGRCCWRCRAR